MGPGSSIDQLNFESDLDHCLETNKQNIIRYMIKCSGFINLFCVCVQNKVHKKAWLKVNMKSDFCRDLENYQLIIAPQRPHTRPGIYITTKITWKPV